MVPRCVWVKIEASTWRFIRSMLRLQVVIMVLFDVDLQLGAGVFRLHRSPAPCVKNPLQKTARSVAVAKRRATNGICYSANL